METNLTSYGGGSYRDESEKLHSALFRFHDAIYFRAGDCLKDALSILHSIEDHPDLRPVCRKYIEQFEDLRERLEALGSDAASFRSRLIRENGCVGNCSERQRFPKENKL